jgi:trehalose-6-phosphate synthase
MKRDTTKKGAITSNKELKEAWIKCWKEMLQTKIQAWIERIIDHIQDVIRLDGGNEYKEGRYKGKGKKRVH